MTTDTVIGFEASNPFYDDTNFPRGFGKSGEFTILESELLHKYGRTLQAIAEGTHTPSTPEEERFLKVCCSKVKPISSLEKVWMKYLQKRQGSAAINALGHLNRIKD